MKNHVSLNIRMWTSKPDKAMEAIILNCHWEYYAAQKAFQYTQVCLKKRWKQGEEVIKKSAYWSYQYARHIIKGRWHEAEEIIAKDCHSSYLYAKYVLKDRFELGEKSFNKNSTREFYLYSKYVLKKRWHEMENKIANKAEDYGVESLVNYARFIMKGRWEKIEPKIAKSRYINLYWSVLKDNEKEEFKNRLLAEALVDPPNSWMSNYARDFLKINKL